MRNRKGQNPTASPLDPGPGSPRGGSAGVVFAPGARASAKGARFDRLDALRGVALVWMAVFHFCFDLSNFRLLDANFYRDPFWTMQRTCILSLFLLCAGAGQAVATAQGQSWTRFWRRWAQVVGCALLVSIGSVVMFPDSYIYFGVLHGMAVMLIVARLAAPLKAWLWPIGAVALALPWLVADPFFDTRWTNWVGLVTHKPITEDYVPVLPWLGVMLWGLAGTQWVMAHKADWLSWAAPSDLPVGGGQGVAKDCGVASTRGQLAEGGRTLKAGAPSGDNIALTLTPRWRLRQGLTTLGRWSLTFYMVHQPVMIGALQAWLALTGRPSH